MTRLTRSRIAFFVFSTLLTWTQMTQMSHAADASLLDDLRGRFTATTVPKTNGDTNPYGLAVVPEGFAGSDEHVQCGDIEPGDTLVSNFNNAAGLQGTGSTIVRICHAGNTFNFFAGGPGLGLTTALGILKKGFVIVGNMPTTDGTCATAKSGSLLVIDKFGKLVSTISSPALLNGPWDLALQDDDSHALLFVSNALSGTVTRLHLSVSDKGVKVDDMTEIASGYLHRCDPEALVIAPTGLAYDKAHDTLFVASTGDNAIYSITGAGSRSGKVALGSVVYKDPAHLRGPLGLALAPGGHLLTSNGDAINPDPAQSSEIVEFTQSGDFVRQLQINPNPGAAFGVTFGKVDGELRFEYVNDATNTLQAFGVK